MVEDLLVKATNFLQYDSERIFWGYESQLQSSIEVFFFDYLLHFKDDWRDKEVLDLGCGTGWLMRLLKENGANFVVGIEPSLKNFERAKNTGFLVHNCTLDSFTPDRKYDLLVSVAVFGHIGDLCRAFEKMANLVKQKGNIHLVIPGYDYFKRKRDGCRVSFKDLDPDEYVIEVTREQGTIVEIVRKVEVYEHAAERVSLTVKDSISMVPTDSLMKESPRHAAFKGQPITYLLRLRK